MRVGKNHVTAEKSFWYNHSPEHNQAFANCEEDVYPIILSNTSKVIDQDPVKILIDLIEDERKLLAGLLPQKFTKIKVNKTHPFLARSNQPSAYSTH